MPEHRYGLLMPTLVLLAGAYGVCFIAALVEYGTSSSVISVFSLSWELARAGERFFSLLPALAFSACAVAMNSASFRESQRALAPLVLVGSALGLAAAAILILLAPIASSNRVNYETRSALFLESGKSAVRESKAGNYARALDLVALAEEIDRRDPELQRLKDSILSASLKADSGRILSAPASAATRKELDFSARDRLVRAQDAAAINDWYTAHYEAGKALALDARNADALRLQARAWERIKALADDPEAAEDADFFKRKLEAYKALREGDALTAWRRFGALAGEKPRDPDAVRYFAESEDALRRLAFFADEARQALGSRPSGRFLARIAGSSGADKAEGSELERDSIIISATAIARKGEAAWLENPEIMGIHNGALSFHIAADYGRLGPDSLLLRAVERPEGSVIREPKVLAGSPPWMVQGVLAPPLGAADAGLVAELRGDMTSVGLRSLLRAARTADRFGLDVAPYRRELASRVGLAAATYTFALIGVGLGARLRARKPGGFASLLFGMAFASAASTPITIALIRSGGTVLDAILAAFPAGAFAVWYAFLACLAALGVGVAARYAGRA